MIKSKKELRSYFKKIRSELSDKENKDRLILNNFKQSGLYLNCNCLFTYVSSEIEVNTRELIKSALKDGKKVACPVCDTEKCTMRFYFIDSFNDLKSGAYGIMEPDTSICKPAQVTEHTLLIVPGLSFDEGGYRLGFGKGYYDRFISSHDVCCAGLCYDECIVPSLPKNQFDQKVSVVVTDRKIYNVS